MKNFKIKDVFAREIIDSRGNPTIETCVTLKSGVKGIAAVPSGASTGKYEAHELRDNDINRYNGKGVLLAVSNVNEKIKNLLINKSANKQKEIDDILLKLDGTENKSCLGANAILSVSLAVAKAAAIAKGIPLYSYINNGRGKTLPVPMCNIINGGAHANNNIDIQEFMIIPVGASTFNEGIRWSAEIFHSLKKILSKKGFGTAVGDEGGFSPDFETAEEALDNIIEAIKLANYIPGKDIMIALDAAASEWEREDGNYFLPKCKKEYTCEQLIDYWINLINKYPIISLEDPLGENDFKGFTKLTSLIGERVQIVGDDLFATNITRLKYGIESKSTNSILIKLNQIGTLTETLETIKSAQDAGFTTVISHRSGETEDTVIADLAVATNSTQIKTGSLSRSERVAKYNRLLGIEIELGVQSIYPSTSAFPQLNNNKKI